MYGNIHLLNRFGVNLIKNLSFLKCDITAVENWEHFMPNLKGLFILKGAFKASLILNDLPYLMYVEHALSNPNPNIKPKIQIKPKFTNLEQLYLEVKWIDLVMSFYDYKLISKLSRLNDF